MVFASITLAAASVATVPQIPVQAEWDKDRSISVKLEQGANRGTDREQGEFHITIKDTDRSLAVSPFIGFTRGVYFYVKDQRGRAVRPAIFPSSGPPAPPLPTERLRRTHEGSIELKIVEDWNKILPGRSTYKIRAIIYLMDIEGKKPKYLKVKSNYVTVSRN